MRQRKPTLKTYREHRPEIRGFFNLERKTKDKQRFWKIPTTEKRQRFLKRALSPVRVTPRIREFALRFPATEDGIRRMINAVEHEIRLVKALPSVAVAMYGRQTADDMFYSRKVPVVFAGKDEPAWGCHALCIALMAALKAKGIPVKFIRTIRTWEQNDWGYSHSVVLFKLGNKTFTSDMFLDGNRMQQVGMTLSERIERLKKLGLWVEADSPEQLGITRFGDYDKYNPEAREQERQKKR